MHACSHACMHRGRYACMYTCPCMHLCRQAGMADCGLECMYAGRQTCMDGLGGKQADRNADMLLHAPSYCPRKLAVHWVFKTEHFS